jgi:hypothetical protein
MKYFSLMAVFAAVSFVALVTTPGQTPQANQNDQQVLALVKDVQAQQAQLIANQAKIDSKLADLAETIRIARIYSSRSGGHK